MNETELNDLVAIASGLPVQETKLTILALVHVITTCMQQGKSVCIPGFGSFAVKNAAARMRSRSSESEAIAARAGRSVEFDPSVHLKNAIDVSRPDDEGPQADDR